MRLIDADELLNSIHMEQEAVGADLSVEAIEAWVELMAENAPDAVPVKPLAALLAWYAMPPVHPKGSSPAELAEAWEEFLQRQPWWQITCGECAVPHNKWTGCPKLGGKITPDNYSCGQGERI